ncbi:16S rRNA pseudouridine(516) synthase [Halioglobus japonicus]|uniref:Pseudouridine synthase n=1 Tax=Halioglobus japonicus TaxID=930805 RepID=A0AAP8MHT0_9GAMM|nr:16S rRNA pseudouridine(516) synthase [Halioglobus japonicus]AQA18990.1 16S rRNA pseudouridine(516) synthase [Halioglobus japonicus]PLW87995.1 16S rRNA pseudouridine(516) synthase [Halioglobus japonicus]
MPSKHARLDRFISARKGIPRRSVKHLLAQRRVRIDGDIAADANHRIGPFTRVEVDGDILQNLRPRYLMMNKPAGVVSATRDSRHTTVLDLIPEEGRDTDLHIAGRLDFNSTGLLLLTNDGRFSRWLCDADSGVIKRYRVTLRDPVTADMVTVFAKGMHFGFEDIVTRPARLTPLASDGTHQADVALSEGRYHQIKRMFGRFNNEVLALHRYAIGPFELDDALAPGQSKAIAPQLPAQWS